MTGLGETIARLAKARKAMQPTFQRGDDAGLTEVRGFGFNPGGLRMLVHVPQDLPPRAALVVVLHGCTQTAGAHARSAGWLTMADRLGFAVVAPEQNSENNPNRCFNWFAAGDIARDAGEAASIHAMTLHMLQVHGLDPERVFITGLSAGGAMTSVLLATYPEAFAGGAVIAGLPYGVAGNVQEAFAVMNGGVRLDGETLALLVARAAPEPPRRPRLSIWHGQADSTVASANAHALSSQWAALHGLSAQPDEVRARRGWSRSVWRGADGEAVVELNLLAGLGHGTPLAAGGDDPIGEVAPYMLEAGVSSSLEIARFWGLADGEPTAQAADWLASAPTLQPPVRASGVGESVMASVSPHVSSTVQQIIAKALGKAGLLN